MLWGTVGTAAVLGGRFAETGKREKFRHGEQVGDRRAG